MDHIQQRREEIAGRIAGSYNQLSPLEKSKEGEDDLQKSEEEQELDLVKSELETDISRLSGVIQSRTNVDGGPNYITKGMQSDLSVKKRQLAHIKQYGELPDDLKK